MEDGASAGDCSEFDFELESEKDTKIRLSKPFVKALQELKYMGFLSATKQSTFIFKKNTYSKPTNVNIF
jgi:hypothetical protein